MKHKKKGRMCRVWEKRMWQSDTEKGGEKGKQRERKKLGAGERKRRQYDSVTVKMKGKKESKSEKEGWKESEEEVCVCVCVVAAEPFEVWTLPNESIMGLSPSSSSVAWYGVGLGRVAVVLCTHTDTHSPKVGLFHGFVSYFVINGMCSCKGPLFWAVEQPETFFFPRSAAVKGALFLTSESWKWVDVCD